jgi:hypothetical protein
MSWTACYSAATPPEAHVVKGFLEQRGVPCVLESQGPTLYPSAAFGMRVRVLVPAEWLPVAEKLIARGRRPRRSGARVVPLRIGRRGRR